MVREQTIFPKMMEDSTVITAVMPTYGHSDLAFVRGEGVYLYTADGRRFLDFGSGIAVTALGHCHPHLVETLQKQAGELWHCSNLYHIPDQHRLAQRLVDNSFADSVFFANSGAEAVECGLKVVRRYQHMTGAPERFRIITCEQAFHGRTLATIAAGGQKTKLDGFGPPVEGFDQVPFGNLNAMRAAITPETAGILVEPVQGEGGMRPATAQYLRELRAIADEFGLLLFFDEVQCGMGRTGKLFAYEWAGVSPDVMALAKGLGGGFPIGACLATEPVAAALSAGTHGSTFGGNPLASAVGNAVLDVMLEDGFLNGVNAAAEMLWSGMRAVAEKYPKIVTEVRGQGLMLGLKLTEDFVNKTVAGQIIDKGLLVVGAGDNVVRLAPPLVINKDHVTEACAIIDAVFAELKTEAA